MNLTPEQKKTLNKIWFLYGNSGKKSTLQNHKLIQGFLHYDEDRREIYRQGHQNMVERFGEDYAQKHGLTAECLLVVDLILDNQIDKAIKIAKQ